MNEVVFCAVDVVLSLIEELIDAEANEIVGQLISKREGRFKLTASGSKRIDNGIVNH